MTAVAVTAVTVICVGGGFAAATAQPAPVTFTACLRAGVLEKVTTGSDLTTCPKGGLLVKWNQKGVDGLNGKSAYELAKTAGFLGTEQDWLASLEGADGGDGDDGASAYEAAQALGFAGTEAEWLASLRGADGANGVAGLQVVTASYTVQIPASSGAQIADMGCPAGKRPLSAHLAAGGVSAITRVEHVGDAISGFRVRIYVANNSSGVDIVRPAVVCASVN